MDLAVGCILEGVSLSDMPTFLDVCVPGLEETIPVDYANIVIAEQHEVAAEQGVSMFRCIPRFHRYSPMEKD